MTITEDTLLPFTKDALAALNDLEWSILMYIVTYDSNNMTLSKIAKYLELTREETKPILDDMEEARVIYAINGNYFVSCHVTEKALLTEMNHGRRYAHGCSKPKLRRGTFPNGTKFIALEWEEGIGTVVKAYPQKIKEAEVDPVNERAMERLKNAGPSGLTKDQMEQVFFEEVCREAEEPHLIEKILYFLGDNNPRSIDDISSFTETKGDVVTVALHNLHFAGKLYQRGTEEDRIYGLEEPSHNKPMWAKRSTLKFDRSKQKPTDEPTLYHQTLGNEIKLSRIVCDVFSMVDMGCIFEGESPMGIGEGTVQEITDTMNGGFGWGNGGKEVSKGTVAYILEALVEAGMLETVIGTAPRTRKAKCYIPASLNNGGKHQLARRMNRFSVSNNEYEDVRDAPKWAPPYEKEA